MADLPPKLQTGYKTALATLKGSKAYEYIDDIKYCKNAIIICAILALAMNFYFIHLMSHHAEALAKLNVFIIQVLMIVGIAYSFQQTKNLEITEKSRNIAWLIFGVGIVFFTLFNLVLICNWKNFKVAIAIVDASADFFAATKRIILVSVFYFFVSLIVLAIFGIGAALVFSMNDIKPSSKGMQLRNFDWKSGVAYQVLAVIFVLAWTLNFIADKTGFICMISASHFYFTSQGFDGNGAVMEGIRTTYGNHLGSLALGSLINAIVHFIAAVTEAMASEVQKDIPENPVVHCFVSCFRCWIKCLEDTLEYLGRTAYAYQAVSGESFCTSAWHGFLLQLKHLPQVYFANSLANLFILLGKVMITLVNCFLLYLIMKYVTKDIEEIDSILGPMLVVALFTFLCTSIFLGLFDEAVLATITCVSIDMDLHDGAPQYGSASFHEKMACIFGETYLHKGQN